MYLGKIKPTVVIIMRIVYIVYLVVSLGGNFSRMPNIKFVFLFICGAVLQFPRSCGNTVSVVIATQEISYEKQSSNLPNPTQLSHTYQPLNPETVGLGWVSWMSIFCDELTVKRKQCCHNCMAIVKPHLSVQ